jgi:hypothetical protein
MFRRSEERSRVRTPAVIAAGGRTLDCVVRDISGRGARLRVTDADAVPPQFELLLKDTGERRPARVRWRKVNEVGVSFTPERRAFGRRQSAPVGGDPEAVAGR